MMDFNRTVSLAQTCCLTKAVHGIDHIESPQQLYLITKPCFKDDNLTIRETMRLLSLAFLQSSQHDTDILSSCTDTKEYYPCEERTLPKNIVYVSFWAICFLFSVIGNSLVFICVYRSRILRREITSLFMVSLALSDILVSFFVISVKMNYTIHNQNFCSGRLTCRFYLTSDAIFFTASIINLLGITINKYIILANPYRYRVIMTRRKAKAFLITIWIYSILVGSCVNINWEKLSTVDAVMASNYRCFVNNKYYLTTVLILTFFIPLLLIGSIDYKIVKMATRQSQSIRAQGKVCSSTKDFSSTSICKFCCKKFLHWRKLHEDACTERKMLAKRRLMSNYHIVESKAYKTTVALYGTFTSCWLPLSVIALLTAWCPKCTTEQANSGLFLFFVEVLPVLNSVINPYIYIGTDKTFKEEVRKLLKRHFDFCSLLQKRRSRLRCPYSESSSEIETAL